MYEIIGKYKNRGCWETIEEGCTLQEANTYLLEYVMAYGRDRQLAIKEIGEQNGDAG